MKDSFKGIIKSVITTVLIILALLICSIDQFKQVLPEEFLADRNIEVQINKEGYIYVEENLNLEVTEPIEQIWLPFNVGMCDLKNIKNVKVYFDGKELKESLRISLTTGTQYVIQNSERIKIENYDRINGAIQINEYKKGEKHSVKIQYEYNIPLLEKYIDATVLKMNIEYKIFYRFTKANIKLVLPKETKKFVLNSGKYTELTAKTYLLDVTKAKSQISILMDKDLVTKGKEIAQTYKSSEQTSNAMNLGYSIYLFIITGIIVLLFIYVFIRTAKPRTKKGYINRLEEDTISPILAEVIIDSKIGVKELVMTTVVDLATRGNIENLGNEQIKLISKNNLANYESDIVNLLFKEENQVIAFEDINTMFLEENIETNTFIEKFNKIKEKILDTLYNNGIYNKKEAKILEIIRFISLLGIVNILLLTKCILSQNSFGLSETWVEVIVSNIIAIIIIFAFKKGINNIQGMNNIHRRYTQKNRYTIIPILLTVSGIIFYVVMSQNTMILLYLLILLILSIIVFRRAMLQSLTSKGKEEYLRLKGLKTYIEQYSLIKEKELESHVIWNKYLAYAVAFNIPNNITNKINVFMLNTNRLLQTIDKILKF